MENAPKSIAIVKCNNDDDDDDNDDDDDGLLKTRNGTQR